MPQKSHHDRYPAPDPYRTWRFLVIQDFAKTKTYRGRHIENAQVLLPILQARYPQARIIFQAQLWIDIPLAHVTPAITNPYLTDTTLLTSPLQEPQEPAAHA